MLKVDRVKAVDEGVIEFQITIDKSTIISKQTKANLSMNTAGANFRGLWQDLEHCYGRKLTDEEKESLHLAVFQWLLRVSRKEDIEADLYNSEGKI